MEGGVVCGLSGLVGPRLGAAVFKFQLSVNSRQELQQSEACPRPGHLKKLPKVWAHRVPYEAPLTSKGFATSVSYAVF